MIWKYVILMSHYITIYYMTSRLDVGRQMIKKNFLEVMPHDLTTKVCGIITAEQNYNAHVISRSCDSVTQRFDIKRHDLTMYQLKITRTFLPHINLVQTKKTCRLLSSMCQLNSKIRCCQICCTCWHHLTQMLTLSTQFLWFTLVCSTISDLL